MNGGYSDFECALAFCITFKPITVNLDKTKPRKRSTFLLSYWGEIIRCGARIRTDIRSKEAKNTIYLYLQSSQKALDFGSVVGLSMLRDDDTPCSFPSLPKVTRIHGAFSGKQREALVSAQQPIQRAPRLRCVAGLPQTDTRRFRGTVNGCTQYSSRGRG